MTSIHAYRAPPADPQVDPLVDPLADSRVRWVGRIVLEGAKAVPTSMEEDDDKFLCFREINDYKHFFHKFLSLIYSTL